MQTKSPPALLQDLVVRLLFTLGNLTAKCDEARLQLFRCQGCTDTLFQVYDSYQRRGASPHAPSQTAEPSHSKSLSPLRDKQEDDDDVLVKLVRVLANMCISPTVGPALATNTTCIQLLMETLGEQRAAGTFYLCSFSMSKSPTSIRFIAVMHTLHLHHTEEAACVNLEF